MKINPGKFNRKIIIQKIKVEKDDINQEIKRWEDYLNIYSYPSNFKAKEELQADKYAQKNQITFWIRAEKKILDIIQSELSLYQISFNNQIYTIEDIENINFENKLIKIKAVLKNEN